MKDRHGDHEGQGNLWMGIAYKGLDVIPHHPESYLRTLAHQKVPSSAAHDALRRLLEMESWLTDSGAEIMNEFAECVRMGKLSEFKAKPGMI
jgi:hypothetical protein